MPYWMRKVQQVIDEIVADEQPYVVFVDNNLGSRPDYLRALCAALRPPKIIWSTAVTIDVTNDPTLVREMALAGCTGVFVGFESVYGGERRVLLLRVRPLPPIQVSGKADPCCR